MTVLKIPDGFVPGAKLADARLEKTLFEAGFTPGFPVASLIDFDELWAIHALSFTEADGAHRSNKPLMQLGVRLPDGSDGGNTRAAPMRVRSIHRSWEVLRPEYWYITGHLETAEQEPRWYLDRKAVAIYHMKVFVTIGRIRNEGYVQFIPEGPSAFIAQSDDLRWASCPSKTPPRVELPKY